MRRPPDPWTRGGADPNSRPRTLQSVAPHEPIHCTSRLRLVRPAPDREVLGRVAPLAAALARNTLALAECSDGDLAAAVLAQAERVAALLRRAAS